MQTSCSITTSLLSDYAFVDHVFTYRTVKEPVRSFTLYADYHMRIVRLCLPSRWVRPLVDSQNRPVGIASIACCADDR